MDPFANYDSWLERPYQDMCDESDRFLDWCGANDVDPDDPEAEDLYMASNAEDYDDVYYDDEADFEEDDGWYD